MRLRPMKLVQYTKIKFVTVFVRDRKGKFADGGLEKISSSTFLPNVEIFKIDDAYDSAYLGISLFEPDKAPAY